MFRPPFLARVAAGAAVYAIEETRRLPTAAMNLPITAISQLLQTTMHVQQFVTSLALKGDAVFDRLGNAPEEQPEWATFDEDLDSEQSFSGTAARTSRFDLYAADEPESPFTRENPAGRNGHSVDFVAEPETAEPETAEPETAEPELEIVRAADPAPAISEPEVATRYDYANMTLAQLRARLRMLTIEDLTALLDYEQQTQDRAPFVTMLTNRIATVRAQ